MVIMIMLEFIFSLSILMRKAHLDLFYNFVITINMGTTKQIIFAFH